MLCCTPSSRDRIGGAYFQLFNLWLIDVTLNSKMFNIEMLYTVRISLPTYLVGTLVQWSKSYNLLLYTIIISAHLTSGHFGSRAIFTPTNFSAHIPHGHFDSFLYPHTQWTLWFINIISCDFLCEDFEISIPSYY